MIFTVLPFSPSWSETLGLADLHPVHTQLLVVGFVVAAVLLLFS